MMHRAAAFAACTTRRLARDPVSLFFGIAFPIILLAFMHLVEVSVSTPVPIFEMDSLAPGMCLFGLAFLTLLIAQIVARDRTSAFLPRLASSPMTAGDFILGYLLPMIPFAAIQILACLLFAGCMGLSWSWNMLAVVWALLPSALLFIGIGILCGTLMTERQVGGICGGLMVTLVAWLAGLFMPLDEIGGGLRATAYALPFVYGANAAKDALAADWSAMWPAMGVVAIWAACFLILSIWLFRARLVQH